MKKFRWTLVFVVAVAGLVAFTVFDTKRSNEAHEQEEAQKSLVRLKIDDVTRIELGSRVGSTVVEKVGDEWKVTAPIQDIGDVQEIETYLTSLDAEKITQTVAQGADANLATYGLDQPIVWLKLATSDGKSQEIKIGSVKAYDSSLYAQIGDEPKVYLVSQSWDYLLSKQAKNFRSKHLLRSPLALDDISRIELRRPGAVFALEKAAGKDASWSMKKIAGKDVASFPVSAESVANFIDQVKGLRAQDILDEAATDKAALLRSGLAKPEFEIVVHLAADQKEPAFWVKFSEEKSKATHQQHLYGDHDTGIEGASGVLVSATSDLPQLVTVTPALVATVKKSPEDFYDKRLPFRFDPKEAAKIQVSTQALKAEFNKKGDVWESADAGLQTRIDSAKLNQLVEKMARLEAVRILGASGSKSAMPSKVLLSKATGEALFELTWGDAVTEKADGLRPESRYVPARTSLTEAAIGIPEGSLKGLELEGIVKPASPEPSPVPTAKH